MRGLCHVHAAMEQSIQYLMTPLPLISCSNLTLSCRDPASDTILSHQIVAGTSRKRKDRTCGPVVLLTKLLSSCALSGKFRPKGIVQTLGNHFFFL